MVIPIAFSEGKSGVFDKIDSGIAYLDKKLTDFKQMSTKGIENARKEVQHYKSSFEKTAIAHIVHVSECTFIAFL